MTTRALALATHSILAEYIAVHDSVFGGSALRKLLPIPGFFEAIDFTANVHQLEALEERLEAIRAEIQLDKSAEPQDDLPQALLSFALALEAATAKLRFVCTKLNLKSRGETYTKREYKRDLAEYEQLVAIYLDLGQTLNRAMQG